MHYGTTTMHNGTTMALCDGCDCGFHLHCSRLAALPEGQFFCAACAPESEGEEGEAQGGAQGAAKALKRQKTGLLPRSPSRRGPPPTAPAAQRELSCCRVRTALGMTTSGTNLQESAAAAHREAGIFLCTTRALADSPSLADESESKIHLFGSNGPLAAT